MHIGIFILLLLSGERNFGVRLNKPYITRVPMDIPVFTGTHADLLIIVGRKNSFFLKQQNIFFNRFSIKSLYQLINVYNHYMIVY
jgi:hypothetical protein